jgi:predicted HTH domain antitoxin
MTIDIPDEILTNLSISPNELRIELATYLYEKQRLSIGKARKIAGLGLVDFQKELSKRQINLHLSIKDLEKELANLSTL